MNLNTHSSGKEAGLNLLLTSAGPTTEAIKEDLLAKALAAKGTSSVIRVLRIADGWSPFAKEDKVGVANRVKQHGESAAAKLWSSSYLKHVLGKHTTETVAIGKHSEELVAELVEHTDLILVPGGNTWQTVRGVKAHQEIIMAAIMSGKPYIGESAGTIIAGKSLQPASLTPADPRPGQLDKSFDLGLELIEADIIVHCHGRSQDIAIPGPLGMLAGLALGFSETTINEAFKYEKVNKQLGIETYILNDDEALTINGGAVLESI